MRRQTTRAIARARKACNLGGSVGPVPKSERITGEFRNPAERPHGQPWLRPCYMSPRRAEEAAGTQRPDDGPPIIPRVHSIARRADGGPVDEYSGLDPIAREGIRLENRGTTDPKQMAKNADINRSAVLDNLPVIGNYRAARRAINAGSELVTAAHYGHGKRKRRAALETVLETAGALTPLPWGRSAGRAAAEGADTARIFAGPTAKTADHAALARAQEMKAAGADRATIWRETGWDLEKADRIPRFEIDDSGARMTPHAERVLDPKGPTGRASGTLATFMRHPELEKAYPDVPYGGMTLERGRGSGAFHGHNDRISLEPRNVPEAKRIGLHEVQHRVQRDEGFAPGGDMFASVQGQEAFWAEKSKLFQEMIENPALAEKFDSSTLFKMAHEKAKQNLNRDWYHRNAGEVEARNVEARSAMDAEGRRALPPWETQDVPEADELVNGLLPGAPQRVFVPAQPSKSADLAREMRLNDVPNRQIFRQTNRFFGPEGRLKADVPDKPMVIRRSGMQEGDTAPVGELIDHPGLFGIHPDLREIPVQFTTPTNARGHPIARTRREGGFEISSGRDEGFYREQFAKLLNYETAKKGGFGGAVLHDVHDQFKAYDDALRAAEDILTNPKPGDDVAATLAYIERLKPMHQQLADGVAAYGGVRDIGRRGGANGIDEMMEAARLRGVFGDATRAANRSTTGNLESRLVRLRSQRDVDGGANSLSRYPYEQGVKIGEVGENWSKAQVLPHRGMSRDDTARLIEDWHKYGVGKRGLDTSTFKKPTETQWNRDYYHGTTSDFKEFKTRGGSSNNAVFVTPVKKFAEMFADGPNGKVLNVGVNKEGFADLNNAEHLDKIAEVLAKKVNKPISMMREQLASRIQNGNLDWAYRDAVNAVKEAGYKGVSLKDAYDYPSLAIFDPKQVKKFARGGRVSRAVARGKAITGGIRGKTGGRADALPVDVPAGAYVIPADVVAALGGGNTEAGMHFLEKRYGRARRANGGAVPILISDGEYVLSPEAVERAGGNDRLDEMVTRTRNAYARHLAELPGPNK